MLFLAGKAKEHRCRSHLRLTAGKAINLYVSSDSFALSSPSCRLLLPSTSISFNLSPLHSNTPSVPAHRAQLGNKTSTSPRHTKFATTCLYIRPSSTKMCFKDPSMTNEKASANQPVYHTSPYAPSTAAQYKGRKHRGGGYSGGAGTAGLFAGGAMTGGGCGGGGGGIGKSC